MKHLSLINFALAAVTGGAGGGMTPEERQDLQDLKKKVEDLETSKDLGVVVIGAPQIHGSQVSGFSADNYMMMPRIIEFGNSHWQLDFQFTTGEDVQAQQNIIDSAFGLALAIAQGKLEIALSSNGTSWNLGAHFGTRALQPNTSYFVRMTFDGSKYVVAISTDRKNYTTDITVNSTASLYPVQIYIGKSPNNAHIFGGSIYLYYAALSINDEIVWTGTLGGELKDELRELETTVSKIAEGKADKIDISRMKVGDTVVDIPHCTITYATMPTHSSFCTHESETFFVVCAAHNEEGEGVLYMPFQQWNLPTMEWSLYAIYNSTDAPDWVKNLFVDGMAGKLTELANELNNKQSRIGDLDAIRTGAALGISALQKSRADELYQPIGQYATRTEVINLINEYLKWGDGLLTLTYNSEENQETILFNKSVLDNAEIIEIDGTEVDASAFTIRNISGPRLSSSDSITNEMANYRFAEAGEHIIRIKYTAKNLGSYSFWNSPKLMAIELPARITTIDADAVAWVGNLASILLSDNITSISDRFCYHCPSLVSFAFPNKISVVSNAALTGCSALSTLILGKSMTAENITTGDNVGAWSLGDLFGLTNIYINGDNPKFTTSLSSGSTICFWNAGRDVPAGVEKSVYYEGNGSFPETLKTNTWLRGWSFYERGVKIN